MKDLTGKIINNILVLCLTENPYRKTQPRQFVPKSEKNRHKYWKCQCYYCDTEFILRSDNICSKICKCRKRLDSPAEKREERKLRVLAGLSATPDK